VSHGKTAEAIKMSFVSRTLVGPGKHLFNIVDLAAGTDGELRAEIDCSGSGGWGVA